MSSVSRATRRRCDRRHRVQRAHVVQPVGELDQDDADVLRHREQHLAEALGLRVLARVELDLVELGDAVDHVGDRLAERRLDLRLGDRGVLHHVVEEGGGEPLRVQAPLRQDARDRERMRDVGLAGLAELAAMGRVREFERALDERDVRRRQVIAEVSGELRYFRHARSSGPCAADDRGRQLCAFSSISMPTLPAAISRSAMTVGLSRSASSSGAEPGADLARAVGRRERQLEAVGDLVETVFDRDAGHGPTVGSGFEQPRRSGRAWRTPCRDARQAGRADDRGQIVDGPRKVLIHNNIIEVAAVAHLFAGRLEPAVDHVRGCPGPAFRGARAATRATAAG